MSADPVTAPIPAGGRPGAVDVHAHHVGRELLAAIAESGAEHGISLVTDAAGKQRVKLGERVTGLPVLPTLLDVDARLRWMDAAGIGRQLVAGWMDLAGYHLPTSAGRWLAHQQNLALAALANSHPDRFLPVAAVPLRDGETAAEELRVAVADLGHRAVQIGARVEDRGLDDPEFEPFWARAESLGVPVIVHPAELDVPDRHRRLFLHILVGNPAETTFAAAALLLGGVLDRHPGLRVLLVHGGGFLPYQVGRLDLARRRAPEAAKPKTAGPVADRLHQVFCDSVLHDVAQLRHLTSVVSAERVLVGSDYPFPMRDDDPVGSVCAAVAAEADRERIQRDNAEIFLGAKEAP